MVVLINRPPDIDSTVNGSLLPLTLISTVQLEAAKGKANETPNVPPPTETTLSVVKARHEDDANGTADAACIIAAAAIVMK